TKDAELTDDEIAGAVLQLFDAGHETVANMLALGVFALLTHEAAWETLTADPSRADVAVEELLRYVSISNHGAFTRTAGEDVELDGVAIKAGESVTVSLAAANHDPKVFDCPGRLDFSREASGHIAFGYGRHICLGQHYARLQLQVALEALATHFPTLRLA